MKKVLLFAAFAAFAMTSVNAQDEDSSGFAKSDIYMSGTVGFNSASSGDADSSDFNFSPAVGYMMSDNIALEAGLSFGGATAADDSEISTVGLNVGARWFMTPGEKFSLSVGVGFGYGTATASATGVDDVTATGISFAVAPAINYWVSDSFGLVATVAALSYNSSELDIDGAEADTSFGLNVDLSDINFGMVYKF